MSDVTMYCDGSGTVLPLPGGYCAILQFMRAGTIVAEKEVAGGIVEATNNIAELTAAIKGLSALTRPCRVKAFCDSEYVVKGFNYWLAGWKRKRFHKVKNADLWVALDKAAEPHHVRFEWVRGHAGNIGNERCDRRAQECRRDLALALKDDTAVHLPFPVVGTIPAARTEQLQIA